MKTRVLASAGLVVLVAVTAMAQGRGFRGFGGGLGGPFTVPPNVRYDGRFTFVRLKYTTAPGGYWYAACRRGRTAIRWPSRTSCGS